MLKRVQRKQVVQHLGIFAINQKNQEIINIPLIRSGRDILKSRMLNEDTIIFVLKSHYYVCSTSSKFMYVNALEEQISNVQFSNNGISYIKFEDSSWSVYNHSVEVG